MTTPRPLFGKKHALEFWRRNAPVLVADGRLTEATYDGFVMLALSWHWYIQEQADPEDVNTHNVVCLRKAVSDGLKDYGMTPSSRKRMGLVAEENIQDVLNRKIGFQTENK